jgi:hypothetical protein
LADRGCDTHAVVGAARDVGMMGTDGEMIRLPQW